MFAHPQLRLDSVRQVFNDGNHNAFTDLCRFRNRFYLTFRSCPDGHMVFPTSSIVVLVSDQGNTWREVFRFNAPHRDLRDPHFLAFQDKLFVYSGGWLCDLSRPDDRDLNDHLGFAAWTVDGETWAGPKALEGTYGHYIWRAAAHGDKAYLCGRRKKDFVPTPDSGDGVPLTQAALLESDDGLVWRYAALFTEEYGDETAFLFDDEGGVLALHRGADSRPAEVCRSRPPYREWTRTPLDRNIGGPLLALWGERYLVGGRKTVGPNAPVTALYFLEDDQLHELGELPSGGDNSYPGFVPLDSTHGLLSYYSSHEGSRTAQPPAAVYLAELSLV